MTLHYTCCSISGIFKYSTPLEIKKKFDRELSVRSITRDKHGLIKNGNKRKKKLIVHIEILEEVI